MLSVVGDISVTERNRQTAVFNRQDQTGETIQETHK